MTIAKEIFEALPEEVKAHYELVGDGYVTVDSLKVGKLKGSLDALDAKFKESQTAAELAKEEAVKAAREEELEKAHKNNDVDEVKRIEREKFEDELKRERELVRSEVESEFTVKQAQKSIDSDIDLLVEKLAVKDSFKRALKLTLEQHIKLDENGNRTYFGDDGSALSITDLKAFELEFSNFDSVADMVKGKMPSNGGLADGGLSGGADKPSNNSRSKLKARLKKHGL